VVCSLIRSKQLLISWLQTFPSVLTRTLGQAGSSKIYRYRQRSRLSDNVVLLRVPTRDEIKQALFSINSTKTSGPDGYGAGFFKKYWNIIQQDFCHL